MCNVYYFNIQQQKSNKNCTKDHAINKCVKHRPTPGLLHAGRLTISSHDLTAGTPSHTNISCCSFTSNKMVCHS